MVVGSFLMAMDLDDVWDVLCSGLGLFETALVSSVRKTMALLALGSITLCFNVWFRMVVN